MSGFSPTVGGALSQGSVFLGSTRHGTSAESTLSLDVVLADGSLLQTGSASGVKRPSPFFRTYGPDLTGLFLGDAGALGIKARATLQLIPFPRRKPLSVVQLRDGRGICSTRWRESRVRDWLRNASARTLMCNRVASTSRTWRRTSAI